MDLKASVAETIERQKLAPPGASILVAVSGGPDSVSLLHCLKSLGYSVEAAHLNHQFRGEEADEDARFVAELCNSLKVNLTSASMDVPKLKLDQHLSAQQAARNARYKFLEFVQAERMMDFLATAHNRDDRVETVLLNILRGTGTDGLKGIPYRRNSVIRPLLDTPRSAVVQYNEDYNLSSRTDSSNMLPKYARNNVRSELLPYLERRYNASVRDGILRLSQIASDESDYLNNIAIAWIAGRSVLPAADLLGEPVALQRRVLRQWIRANVATELSDVSHVLVEQLRKRLDALSSTTFPGGRFVAESDGGAIRIRELARAEKVTIDDIPAKVGLELLFGDYLVTVTTIGTEIDEPSLYLKQWKDGDRITLKGGTRKVQDIFTDRKVPRDVRRRYPLVADKDGVVSVGDICCSLRAAGTTVRLVTAD